MRFNLSFNSIKIFWRIVSRREVIFRNILISFSFLIPAPFVDLSLSESCLLSYFLHDLFGPVRIFLVNFLEKVKLIVRLSFSASNDSLLTIWTYYSFDFAVLFFLLKWDMSWLRIIFLSSHIFRSLWLIIFLICDLSRGLRLLHLGEFVSVMRANTSLMFVRPFKKRRLLSWLNFNSGINFLSK